MDFFDTPSIWTLLIVALLAATVAALVVKFLSPPRRPLYEAGVSHALTQIFFAAKTDTVDEAYALLDAQVGPMPGDNEGSRAFDRGILEAIEYHAKLDRAGVFTLERLQFRLNHMVNTGEASLSEVCVALNVIDELLGVGVPTNLEPTP